MASKRSANKLCPRCNKLSMQRSGKIKGGIKGGLRRVYRCKNCNYQSMR